MTTATMAMRNTMQTWVPRLSSDVRTPLAVSQTLIKVPLLLAVANRVPAMVVAIIIILRQLRLSLSQDAGHKTLNGKAHPVC